MLLAGIVVTIAFILTSLTLSQVSSLERQSAAEQRDTIAEEWRFLHARLASNLEVAVTTDTTNDTFLSVSLPTIVATFRGLEAEKGYDAVIRLAGDGTMVNKTERSLVASGSYAAWDAQGLHHFNDPWDQVADGILWEQPCPDDEAPPAGCIAGILLFVHLTDGATTMEEVILFHVNRAS